MREKQTNARKEKENRSVITRRNQAADTTNKIYVLTIFVMYTLCFFAILYITSWTVKYMKMIIGKTLKI